MTRLGFRSLMALAIALLATTAAWAYYTTPGEGTSTTGKVGTLTDPEITVPETSTGTHAVSWTAAELSNPDEADDVTYTVERKLDDGEFGPATDGCAGSFTSTTTSCTDTVGASGDYTYRVVAEFRTWTATSEEAGPVVATLNSDTTAPTVTSIVRAGTSPTNDPAVDFTVTFSEPVTGVDATDFDVPTTGSITGAQVTTVNGADDVYTVTVGTGTGDGTVGLDLDDDDSVKDSANNALVGPSTTNGDYTGETYQVDKSAPTATITRTGTTPTSAASVSWTVQFSEGVTGLALDDFQVSQTGLTGAALTTLAGSGDTYTLTANTGSGSGSINVTLQAQAARWMAPATPSGATWRARPTRSTGPTPWSARSTGRRPPRRRAPPRCPGPSSSASL